MGAYRAGNVALANAVGNGVADDKAIYAYVPTFIRYYLGEEPILRSVDTYLCTRPDDLCVRARSSDRTGGEGRGRIRRLRHADGPDGEPRKDRGISASDRGQSAKLHGAAGDSAVARAVLRSGHRRHGRRHVDLRPYCLYDGQKVTIVPGGLTRVALQRESLVVNSSQGGGSKDTWVLRGEGAT